MVLAAGFFPATPTEARFEKEKRQVDVWLRETTEEFLFYREMETALVETIAEGTTANGDFPRNLHRELQPSFSLTGPNSEFPREYKVRYATADKCRVAIRELNWLRNETSNVRRVVDGKFRQYAKTYVAAARECEQALKLKPYRSKLRDIVDAGF